MPLVDRICAKRVKNPCIVCLQSVKKKNGVQCSGACQKWAHYTCLNFSPGKIKDIKAGLITIVCPCPKCDNQGQPKEVTKEPHILCNHQLCPANQSSKCENIHCPLNEKRSNMPCDSHFCSSKGIPLSVTSYPRSPYPYNQAHPIDSSNIPLYHQNPALRIPSSCMQRLTSQPQLSAADPLCTYSWRGWTPYRAPMVTTGTSYEVPYTPAKVTSCSCFTSQEISNRNMSRNADENALTKDRLRHSDSRLIFIRQAEKRQVLSAVRELCTTVGDLSHEIKNLMAKILNEPQLAKRDVIT